MATSPEMNEMLFDRLENTLRDMAGNEEQPVTPDQVVKLVETAMNHPMQSGTRPFVEVLGIVLHRLSSDPEMKAKLEETPMKPVIAFIPLFTQVISETKDVLAVQEAK